MLVRLRLIRSLCAVALAAVTALPGWAADAGTSPMGRWMTANHNAVIQIAPCGKDLCGQIVGIALAHPNDPMPKNWQGAPQCGMMILQTAPAMESSGATAWVGSVLDPRDGTVYNAKIMLGAFRHLLLQGYVGLPIFGRTQTWTPYSGMTLADCRLAFVPHSRAANG